MICRPTRSTRFPYTTLFRSRHLAGLGAARPADRLRLGPRRQRAGLRHGSRRRQPAPADPGLLVLGLARLVASRRPPRLRRAHRGRVRHLRRERGRVRGARPGDRPRQRESALVARRAPDRVQLHPRGRTRAVDHGPPGPRDPQAHRPRGRGGESGMVAATGVRVAGIVPGQLDCPEPWEDHPMKQSVLRGALVALPLIAVLVLTGCSKNEEVAESAPPPPPPAAPVETPPAAPPTETTPPPTDEAGTVQNQLKDVYYDYDSANLSSEAQSTLDADGKVLMDNASVSVQIEGHC